jgi:hypothetical protein
MSQMIPERAWIQWMPACGIAAVIVFYAQFLYQHALNIPYHDDIVDVVQLLINVTKSAQLTHTFSLFFERYNEHHTLASRLIYYSALLLEGEINFRTLTFLANAGLLLLLLLLYLAMRKNSRALLILLPAALVLFQLRAYGLIFWAMASFAYIFVYVYGFASILCLRRATAVRFLAAIGFAILGTFTLATGQLIWLVGLVSLLHQSLILRRISTVYSACWLVIAVLFLTAWHVDYTTPVTISSNLQSVVSAPLHYMGFFLALLGSAVSASSVWLAVFVGGFLVFIVSYSAIRNVAREDITLELFAGYIILTVAVITFGRAFLVEQDYALVSRYSFPSIFLLATVIVLCLSRLPENARTLKISFAVVGLMLAYWVHSFQAYSPFLQGALEARVNDYNSGFYFVYGEPIKETNAISLGLYNPPSAPHALPTISPMPTRQ